MLSELTWQLVVPVWIALAIGGLAWLAFEDYKRKKK
jgi:hypothetical protein